MPYTLKIKIRKSRRHKRINTKRNTRRYKKGGAVIIEVEYNGIPVSGQLLKRSKTIGEPRVKFTGEPGKLYTFIMWDPDVPEQIQPGFAHWIATNLHSQNNIASNELLSYHPPSPPSGTHRYFFGIFEQEGHINPQQPPRTEFSIDKFVQGNNLKKVAEVFMKVAALNV